MLVARQSDTTLSIPQRRQPQQPVRMYTTYLVAACFSGPASVRAPRECILPHQVPWAAMVHNQSASATGPSPKHASATRSRRYRRSICISGDRRCRERNVVWNEYQPTARKRHSASHRICRVQVFATALHAGSWSTSHIDGRSPLSNFMHESIADCTHAGRCQIIPPMSAPVGQSVYNVAPAP